MLSIKRAKGLIEQTMGLAGKGTLDGGTALLFEFPISFYYPFWNFGMKFPIDIVWLDENRCVVQVSECVPKMPPLRFYINKKPAKYVLEMKAGEASKFGLFVGAVLSSPLL